MAFRLPRFRALDWGLVLNETLVNIDERLKVLEDQRDATVGPQGPPGTGVARDPIYEGLQLVFGPEPLPPPASMPNTVYVILPPPPD